MKIVWVGVILAFACLHVRAEPVGIGATEIGMDLRNEPHNAHSGGACWTGDSRVACPEDDAAHNWPAAAARAGNAILAVNPDLLIFVEGTDCFGADCDWWGGNLAGVSANPAAALPRCG